MKRNAVLCFGGHFLWSIFRARLGKFVQKSFVPPKICLLLHLAYATRHLVPRLQHFVMPLYSRS